MVRAGRRGRGTTKDFRHRQPAAMTWDLARGGALLPHGTRGQRSEWPACRVCIGLVTEGSRVGTQIYKYVYIWCLQKYKTIAKAPKPGSRALKLDLEGNR